VIVAEPESVPPLADVASGPPDAPPPPDAEADPPGEATLPPSVSVCVGVGAPVEAPALLGLGELEGAGRGEAGTRADADPDPGLVARAGLAGEDSAAPRHDGSGPGRNPPSPRPVGGSFIVARPLSPRPPPGVASGPPDAPPPPGAEAVATGGATTLPPSEAACLGAPVEVPALSGLSELEGADRGEPGTPASTAPDPIAAALDGRIGEVSSTVESERSGEASASPSPRPVGESVSSSSAPADEVGVCRGEHTSSMIASRGPF
jgi:hypothetical protein